MENIITEKQKESALTKLLDEQLYREKAFDDKVWTTGLLMLALSLGIFCLTFLTRVGEGGAFGTFVINYATTFIFFLVVVLNRGFLKRSGIHRRTMGHTTLFLVLFLVSAYALNRVMFVFQDSVPWLSVFLVLAALPYVCYNLYPQLPKGAQLLFCFLLGTSLVLWVYLTLYLVPVYPVSFIGLIALGIGAHCFVPLLLLIYGIRVTLRTCTTGWHRAALILGLAVPLAVTGVFLQQWKTTRDQVTRIHHRLETEDFNELPAWVRISQTLEKNWVTDKFIKSDLVFVSLNQNWSLGAGQFNDVKSHDPLVAVAGYLFGKPNLGPEEKIKILETTYDARHQAQEQLWSGQHLQTSSIVTRARIYPAFRMAYSEKTFRIRNTTPQTWRPQEEALYTFHLPEGAVVTSLSLWINGREEKGYLTTKSKADSAYTQIVGREARDPSVVHWQEGNAVVVRVFPCTPTEERQFKIGVTTPLRQEGNRLVFRNYYFEGPPATDTQETIFLQFDQQPVDLKSTVGLDEGGDGSYAYEGAYQSNWELSFSTPVLPAASFQFDGQQYAVSALAPRLAAFTPQAIYLDVNKSWTESEWQTVLNQAGQVPVFVHTDGLTRVNAQNRDTLFRQLQQKQFTLFPIHAIKDSNRALLVTKSSLPGPNLQDIKGSVFADKLKAFLATNPQLRTFNLGSEKSDYLRTLKEMRVLVYDEGRAADLADLLKQGRFIRSQEDASTVVLDEAGIKITTAAGEKATSGLAPDHLLRLFAYNDILKKVSRHYFKADAATDELIAEAAKANVVSPVSSLVVLETQADYERFGITKSKNSLGNASAKAAGAVPEPHEWALIILALLGMGYLLFRSYQEKRATRA